MISSLQLNIIENTKVAPGVYRLVLLAPSEIKVVPGQFFNLKIPGKSLRRPISVMGQEGRKLIFVYKTVGEGTKILSSMTAGQSLEALGPLGNGFSLPLEPTPILLVGGGIGTPPLMMLSALAVSKGFPTTLLFGFRTKEDALFLKETAALAASLSSKVNSAAEVAGVKKGALTVHYVFDEEGENVVSAMKKHGLCDLPFFACGPLPMLKAVSEASWAGGQCSLETRMGCGFGACMGCSLETTQGMKRVCKEGPVFQKEEILWEALM